MATARPPNTPNSPVTLESAIINSESQGVIDGEAMLLITTV